MEGQVLTGIENVLRRPSGMFCVDSDFARSCLIHHAQICAHWNRAGLRAAAQTAVELLFVCVLVPFRLHDDPSTLPRDSEINRAVACKKSKRNAKVASAGWTAYETRNGKELEEVPPFLD
jgi:hypothetical protein